MHYKSNQTQSFICKTLSANETLYTVPLLGGTLLYSSVIFVFFVNLASWFYVSKYRGNI